ITDPCFSHFRTVDIPLNDILINDNIKTFDDLRDAMDRLPITESTVYRFVVERLTYSNIAQVRELLLQAGIDLESHTFLKIRESYWNARQVWPMSAPFENTKIKVVIHLRIGDIAVLPLGNRNLYI